MFLIDMAFQKQNKLLASSLAQCSRTYKHTKLLSQTAHQTFWVVCKCEVSTQNKAFYPSNGWCSWPLSPQRNNAGGFAGLTLTDTSSLGTCAVICLGDSKTLSLSLCLSGKMSTREQKAARVWACSWVGLWCWDVQFTLGALRNPWKKWSQKLLRCSLLFLRSLFASSSKSLMSFQTRRNFFSRHEANWMSSKDYSHPYDNANRQAQVAEARIQIANRQGRRMFL